MELTWIEDFNAPPERVFAAITDLESWHKWMQNVVKIEKLTPGPFGKGTQWRETRKIMGKDGSEYFEVVAFEPPRAMEFYVDGTKGSNKKGEYRFTYTFENIGGKTRMTVHGSITGLGCMGVVFGFLFKGFFRKAIAKDHEAFRKHLESAT